MAIPLSQTLKNVKANLNQQAMNTTAAGQSANGIAVQQALTQGPVATGVGAKATAQQMAPKIADANAQVATQATATNTAATQAAGQAALQQSVVAADQQLKQTAAADDATIAEMQRSGKARQNSAELASTKRIQDAELGAQRQLSVQGTAFDNNLSFLTRKQREDLSKLGSLTKQQLFDSRLQFAQSDAGRKFTNMRQLADYSTATSASEQQLQSRLQNMQQAFEMESIILESASKIISQQLDMEMRRAEQGKDNALALELAERKAALQRKLARKKAQAAATSNIITGAFTIAGAVAGAIISIPTGGVAAPATVAGGAALGASLGGAIGGVTAGAVNDSNV